MKHRRSTEELKQTILKVEADAQKPNMTIKKACLKNKIKPSQYYDKRKGLSGTRTVKLVNVPQGQLLEENVKLRAKIKFLKQMLREEVLGELS